MREAVPRPMGAWLVAWAAILLALAALAAWEGAPESMRVHLGTGRFAANAGLGLLLAIGLVLPFTAAGPRRLLEDLALTLILTAPFALVAADWAPVDPSRGGAYAALLASQALLATAASAAGVSRHGRTGTLYLTIVVALLLGAPFLAYIVGETTRVDPLAARFLSSLQAARPLLLDRSGTLAPGFHVPALAVNLVLAAAFGVRALTSRRPRS